jgi:hypothetical protein
MALFKKGRGGGSGEPLVVEAASTIPDYGFNQPAATAGVVSDLQKTTCYPPDMGGRARFSGRERTSSYQQSSVYNRRTYDTIN